MGEIDADGSGHLTEEEFLASYNKPAIQKTM
eukprot:CAMPEP_0115349524 /NCGR_PEP_ID=MMETSP0270-20121206/95972_1 /TAXON_ID=71861 /ORGANISM="Scrippsiella trochoidea, Strain CCMP3099" /LENGTH=30 /DNA_ID= /DNA_START= /DNA_END= /DNA_ORIENTATION=